MLRRLGLLVLALALPLVTMGTVPSNINLHNGYVTVVNNVRFTDTKGNATFPVRVHLSRHNGIGFDMHWADELWPGQQTIINNCCIVAGARYQLSCYTTKRIDACATLDERPRLCNVRGIPFGYAAFEITGEIWYEGVDWKSSGLDLHRIDTGCP
jgi:hypothetical protein